MALRWVHSIIMCRSMHHRQARHTTCVKNSHLPIKVGRLITSRKRLRSLTHHHLSPKDRWIIVKGYRQESSSNRISILLLHTASKQSLLLCSDGWSQLRPTEELVLEVTHSHFKDIWYDWQRIVIGREPTHNSAHKFQESHNKVTKHLLSTEIELLSLLQTTQLSSSLKLRIESNLESNTEY